MSVRAENAVSGVTVTNCSMLCSLACKNILVRISSDPVAVVDIPGSVVVVCCIAMCRQISFPGSLPCR